MNCTLINKNRPVGKCLIEDRTVGAYVTFPIMDEPKISWDDFASFKSTIIRAVSLPVLRSINCDKLYLDCSKESLDDLRKIRNLTLYPNKVGFALK